MSSLWFYHKKLIIFVTTICALVALLVVTMMYIKSPTYPNYYIIEEDINEQTQTAIVSDGKYLYDLDYTTKELQNKRMIAINNANPALDLRTKQNYYRFKSVGNSKYEGTLDDALAYIDTLEENSYYTVSLFRCDSYIDIVLTDDKISVRVIATSTGTTEIFSIDSGKNVISPPYINEEGLGGQ